MKRILELLYEHWPLFITGLFILVIILAAAGARNIKNTYTEAGWQQVKMHAFVDNNGDSVLIKSSGNITTIYIKRDNEVHR